MTGDTIQEAITSPKCPFWEDGEHCYVPDTPGHWPDEPPYDRWEGPRKVCACGAEVSQKRERP